jgi:hypothetical protein
MNTQNKTIKEILSLYNTILENKNVNETAQDLRNTLKSLGSNYSEKGDELTSGGGDVDTKLTKIVSELLTLFKEKEPNVKVRITAGDDETHRGEKYKNSLHNKGKAIDLTIDPYNSSTAKSFTTLVSELQKKYPDFGFLDEYKKQSPNATGPHYHLQIGKVSTNNSDSPTDNDTPNDTSNVSNSGEYGLEYDPLIDMLGKGIGKIFGVNENNKLDENINRIKDLL